MEKKFSKFERRPFRTFEKPVKVGNTYDVEIKEVGSKGDGIARVKNFVVFVPGTKKGEKCKIKINDVRRRFAIGEKV
ncbi:MAG TPA: TRAM domain-containing protein [Candidatus Aenigmarchaeota archaeon]|nr:TRAM domain-containing protein [Candidatus Aenigmarchaeota archaeon]